MPSRKYMSRKEIIRVFFIYWLPFLCYVCVIFYLSHQSEPLGGITVPLSDKIIHFFEFFLLVFLAMRAFHQSPWERIRKHFLLVSIIFSFFYAFSDEFHQSFISNRESSIFDFCADSFGIIVGSYIFRNRIV